MSIRLGKTGLVVGLACATLATLGSTTPLLAQGVEPKGEPSAVGLWQVSDANGRAWFQISERNGVYQGQIVKMFFREGDDPNPICSRCEGERHNAPWLGLTIITGMKRDGLAYEDGRILDPRDGNIYNAQMRISPDGQTLTVRGYLGISMLGRDQTWQRLPESAATQIDRAPKTQGSGKR